MSLTFVQRVPFYARNSLLCLHTHHEVLSVKHFDMYSQFFMNSWDVLSIRFDMYSQFMNSQFMKHFDMYSQFSLISILNSWIHAQSTFAHISLSVIYSQNTPIQNSLFAHITLKLKMACRLLNSNDGILNFWNHKFMLRPSGNVPSCVFHWPRASIY